MKVIISDTTGFCSGVKKAIKGAEEALKKDSTIYCLGDIIHNKGVVNKLKSKGMIFVNSIDDIPSGNSFVIRSHGLPFDMIKNIEKMAGNIYDFTCPKVKKSHRLVESLKDRKKPIVIIGNKDHPEVKAIHSLTKSRGMIIEKPEDVKEKLNADECYVLVQTTFKPDLFYDIVKIIISVTKKATIYNTLCEETTKRQQEVKKLAKEVDMIVVVGGKNSSNTKTLFSIASSLVKAIHIENAGELQMDLFQGIERVGIVSGASTPDEEIERVVSKINILDRSNKV